MNAKLRLMVLIVIVGLSLMEVACEAAVGVGVAVPYGNPWGYPYGRGPYGRPYGGPYGGGTVIIGGGPVIRH